MKLARVLIQIHGNVQGVYFRANTEITAKNLGLTGWVRNTRDGGVEALFEGKEDDVKKAAEWCKKGPRFARVDKTEEKWEKHKNEFTGFLIRYD